MPVNARASNWLKSDICLIYKQEDDSDGLLRSLLALLATLLSLRLFAGSISVAGWSLCIIWAVCFPFIWPQASYWSTSFSAISCHVIRIFILGLTDQLNHNSY